MMAFGTAGATNTADSASLGVSFMLSGTLANSGALHAGNALTVSAATLDNHSEAGCAPVIAARDRLAIDASYVLNDKSRILSAAAQVPGAAAALDAPGRMPGNSLFRANPDPAGSHLVATDPRFANYRQWLGSDYLLNALSADPATLQKRLGDGFYEQKLIREQVAQLTGRRFLAGYANDEAQYQALLDNAVTFAQAHQLRPGVTLTAEQMAALTSDIVWLVEKDVTLADGGKARALVPQLYLRVREGDLAPTGALIAGDSLHLELSGDLFNAGTLAGRDVVRLTADNLANHGGTIRGADVAAQARTDLDTIGGSIAATDSLSVAAGRDLNVISTVRTQSNAQGSRTNLDRVAGLYVSGGGTLPGHEPHRRRRAKPRQRHAGRQS